MEPITRFTGKVVPLAARDVDTDQITPARFLKVTDKKGLGKFLFYDWRYEGDGKPKPDFILNQPRARGAKVLVAGDNFGCGSSREHAPWALHDFGFRAVVSTSFADIFRGNCLKNGIVPVVVDQETHARLIDRALADPEAQVTVDLESQTITLPDGSTAKFPIDAFSKKCLLAGVDQLGYILQHQAQIAQFEQRRASS